MIKFENRCVGCATDGYPCLGYFCSLTHQKVLYCDKCGEEVENLYSTEGKELCKECLLEKYEIVHKCSICGDELEGIYEVDGKEICEFCLRKMFKMEE